LITDAHFLGPIPGGPGLGATTVIWGKDVPLQQATDLAVIAHIYIHWGCDRVKDIPIQGKPTTTVPEEELRRELRRRYNDPVSSQLSSWCRSVIMKVWAEGRRNEVENEDTYQIEI